MFLSFCLGEGLFWFCFLDSVCFFWWGGVGGEKLLRGFVSYCNSLF